MKKLFNFINILIFLTIIIILISIASLHFITGSTIKQTQQALPAVIYNVTESNFASYLSLNQIVQNLPSSSIMYLKTSYKDYIIKKGSVTEGIPQNPDITISLHSSYIPEMSNGFCAALSNAYKNGDLSATLNIPTVSAAWKYSSLLKYKSCLGL